ncbi:MAG TPA: fatty acid hydroxylase, partial [Methylococcaceae bacterium]|nr:fatty acid hydroxylase [Methylococcaceae bacterium]
MTQTMNASMNLFEAIASWPMITSFDLAGFTLLMFFIILSAIEAHRPRKKLPKQELKNSYRV